MPALNQFVAQKYFGGHSPTCDQQLPNELRMTQACPSEGGRMKLIRQFTTITQSLNNKPTSSASSTTSFFPVCCERFLLQLRIICLSFKYLFLVLGCCLPRLHLKTSYENIYKKIYMNLSMVVSRVIPSSPSFPVLYFSQGLYVRQVEWTKASMAVPQHLNHAYWHRMILTKFSSSVQYRDAFFLTLLLLSWKCLNASYKLFSFFLLHSS